ncbi:MAG TPA: DALR domain-containing protein, partial [Gemmataceae bacterium]|nr:DALR domain-containing protein [Gemmataceae bacterium]
CQNWFQQFRTAMDDDFNTGGGIGFLYHLLNELNRDADTRGFEQQERRQGPHYRAFLDGAVVLKVMSNILGLFWAPPVEKKLGGDDQLTAGLMQLLIDLRNNLRTEAKAAAKDNPLKKPLFDQTDLIRKRLGELGVTLEDRADKTEWRVK